MILSFKTKIHGKPTYFVEKILKTFDERDCSEAEREMLNEAILNGYLDPIKYDEVKPKLHTIRKDDKNRWKAGMMIDFFINARQKDMFRFAPKIPVISTQRIRIKYTTSSGNTPLIYVEVFGETDWKCLDTYNPDLKISSFKIIEKLAINDGFENLEEFFQYFNENFEGKIIHWTDFKY